MITDPKNIPDDPETAYWIGRYHEAVKVRGEERVQLEQIISNILASLLPIFGKTVPMKDP